MLTKSRLEREGGVGENVLKYEQKLVSKRGRLNVDIWRGVCTAAVQGFCQTVNGESQFIALQSLKINFSVGKWVNLTK